ncbi:MAG: ERCC4 domain-containing protein [Promethearchaeota archaeon]
MSKNNPLKIIVDNRERKLIELLDKNEKIRYEAKQLDIADIVVSSEVGIERKEGFDFVSSIIDNRLVDQLTRLRQAYSSPILILEGLNNDVFANTGMRKSSIYGMLSKISYKMGIAIIPTLNISDTVIVIERIAFREQIKKDSSIISRSVPKEMSKKERRTFIIEGLANIGPKKAKILIETFKTPGKVIEAIKKTRIIYTRTGNPKGIEGPLKSLQGFGWKFVKENKEILFGKRSVKKPQKQINDLL